MKRIPESLMAVNNLVNDDLCRACQVKDIPSICNVPKIDISPVANLSKSLSSHPKDIQGSTILSTIVKKRPRT